MRLRLQGAQLSRRFTPRSNPLLMMVELKRQQAYFESVRAREKIDHLIDGLSDLEECYSHVPDPKLEQSIVDLYLLRWIRRRFLTNLLAPEFHVGFAMIAIYKKWGSLSLVRKNDPKVIDQAIEEFRGLTTRGVEEIFATEH